MWVIRNIPRVNHIIQEGIGEAYDLGFDNGVTEGTKASGSRKEMRRIEKIIRKKYKGAEA